MGEFLRQLWTRVTDIWESLSRSARVNIVVTLGALAVVIISLFYFGTRPQYVELFDNLDPKEVDRIQQILAEQRIPYRMAEGWRAVQVRDIDAGRAQTKLREQDLPTRYGDPEGYERLDRESLFVSPEKHRENVRIAREGELMRMLNRFDFIKRSYVRIDYADEDLLMKSRRPATAAVTIETTHAISQKEIDMVLGHVAAFGGADLKKANISLASTDGIALHVPTDDEHARLASDMHGVIRAWEQERERRVEDMFSAMSRKAIARVSAKLDMSEQEVLDSRVEEGVEFSVLKSETQLTTRESLPEGPAGAQVNLPEGVLGPTETETIETTQENLINNEPSRIQTRTRTRPGDTLEYKVSVIIDWGYTPVLDDDGEIIERKYGPPDDLEEYQLMVANAVGTNVNIDDVFIKSVPFQLDQIEHARAAIATLGWLGIESRVWDAILTVLKALIVIAMVIVLRWYLLKLIAPVEELEEEEAEAKMPAPSAEELRKQKMARDVENLAQEQPDAVASLLRAWMSEDEE